jgi:hypothetical protein
MSDQSEWRRVEDPVEFVGEEDSLAERKVTHPSFGQISASRVSGGAFLYGSDFQHQHFIKVSISHSVLNRSLSRDWPFAGKEITEVWMSEAQWATFVSSLNVGMGVQCTLRHINHNAIPMLSGVPKRHDQFRAEAAARMQIASDQLKDLGAEIQSSSLSQKAKNELIGKLNMAQMNMIDNIGFVAKQFSEHIETTVEAAKVEVNAYIQGTISRAGLTALGVEPVLQLPESKP